MRLFVSNKSVKHEIGVDISKLID
ncbi:hypothetical protein AGR7B_pAt0011 [Agrobacterium deltaense RV3]|nr:hypothetical protein AGR7B_pAt0011 [Agrobacterium deltaense RV3]